MPIYTHMYMPHTILGYYLLWTSLFVLSLCVIQVILNTKHMGISNNYSLPNIIRIENPSLPLTDLR